MKTFKRFERPIFLIFFGILIWGNGYRVQAQSFSDVDSGNLHFDAIEFSKSDGIITGYSDGTFKPNQDINRAEFIKVIISHIYKGRENFIDMCPGASGYYTDVSRDAWYGHFLCRATDDHIVGGYPDKTFRPNESVNFAEAAKIISEATMHIVDPSTFQGGDGFYVYDGRTSPIQSNGPWYEKYVSWLAQYKAIPLDITSFDQKLTRGQVIEILYRLIKRISKDSQTYDSIGNISGFSPVDVCGDPPTPGTKLDTKALTFPIKQDYLSLGYLGEIFTAAECGGNRLEEFRIEAKKHSLEFFTIFLKDPATDEMSEWFERNEFKSLGNDSKKWVNEWPGIDQLFELRKYAALIRDNSCNSCYRTMPQY